MTPQPGKQRGCLVLHGGNNLLQVAERQRKQTQFRWAPDLIHEDRAIQMISPKAEIPKLAPVWPHQAIGQSEGSLPSKSVGQKPLDIRDQILMTCAHPNAFYSLLREPIDRNGNPEGYSVEYSLDARVELRPV